MEKVAVIILNYLNYTDTIECLESLISDSYQNKEIIVVDNGSANESKTMIQKYIEKKNVNIHFLINTQNKGYARGNNVGINFARQKLNCTFVLIVNNDTVFVDNKLIEKLVNAYEEGIGIIGPRIISKDGYEQNPHGKLKGILQLSEIDEMEPKSISRRKIVSLVKKHLSEITIFKINQFLKKIKNMCFDNMQDYDFVLQGSCFMLTKDYFKYYDRLYPKTFLYYEEAILTILTNKVNLNKKIVTGAKIYHKESQSSLLSFNNEEKIITKYFTESRILAIKLLDMNFEEINTEFFEHEFKDEFNYYK